MEKTVDIKFSEHDAFLKPNNLKVFGSKKKGLNRIAKIGYGHMSRYNFIKDD